MKENSKPKSPKQALPDEDDRWVDVHDDALMVELGIRCPNLKPRDPSVWTKTPYERRILKTLRHTHKGEDTHFHDVPRKIIPVWAKLIIQLKKNNKFEKTTYSTECWQHEIPQILSNYQVTKRKGKEEWNESVVAKYSWNGRTYQPSELPFWGFTN